KRTEAGGACRPLKMRTHAQARIVANLECKRRESPHRPHARCIRIGTEFGNACEEIKNWRLPASGCSTAWLMQRKPSPEITKLRAAFSVRHHARFSRGDRDR